MKYIEDSEMLSMLDLPRKPIEDFQPGDIAIEDEDTLAFFVERVEAEPDGCVMLYDGFRNGTGMFPGTKVRFVPQEWLRGGIWVDMVRERNQHKE